MENLFSRTEILLGSAAVELLKTRKIAIFGLGGVGGACVEALARAGIGQFLLIDNDTVSESNINRQIIALYSTIGQKKTDVMKRRILDINPQAAVETLDIFVLPQNLGQIKLQDYDFIIDAIDTMSAKIAIAEYCFKQKLPIISCMGAGNRLSPRFEAADIYKTKNCPVAKTMRRELKKRGITSLKTVFSLEEPITPKLMQSNAQQASHGDGTDLQDSTSKSQKGIIGSVSFVPSAAGLMLAAEAVKELLQTIR